ncbi:MAG: MATE family efflux transporter [Firmicutes bacterium]|nr:MATE family efflux transporter [Bacillota bacterium]
MRYPLDKKRTLQLLKIASPSIVEQLLVVLVGIVSIAVIGHLGSNQFVAAAMTNTIVNWLQSIYIGLSAGGMVVISRMWGSGKTEDVKKAFMQNIIITVLLSLIVFSFTLIFKNHVILFFFGGADDDVLKNIHAYFAFSMTAMPATAILTVINAGVRGIGDNKTPLYSTGILNALNLLLSVMLIQGFAPFKIPPMGMTGAGIAVMSSKYISALFTGVYVYIKKRDVLISRSALAPQKRIAAKILKIGVPSMLEQLIFQGGFVVLQTMLISFGTVLQGGYQIGANINGITNAPFNGLSVAVTVMISHALGKRDFEKATEIVKTSKAITIIGFLVLGTALFGFAPLIVKIYASDAIILESGKYFARVFAISLLPVSYFIVMAAVLRGGGDMRYVAATSIIGLWVGRLFLFWFIGKITGNGYIAVASGLLSDFIFRSVMYHFRVQKGRWKFIRI